MLFPRAPPHGQGADNRYFNAALTLRNDGMLAYKRQPPCHLEPSIAVYSSRPVRSRLPRPFAAPITRPRPRVDKPVCGLQLAARPRRDACPPTGLLTVACLVSLVISVAALSCGQARS